MPNQLPLIWFCRTIKEPRPNLRTLKNTISRKVSANKAKIRLKNSYWTSNKRTMIFTKKRLWNKFKVWSRLILTKMRMIKAFIRSNSRKQRPNLSKLHLKLSKIANKFLKSNGKTFYLAKLPKNLAKSLELRKDNHQERGIWQEIKSQDMFLQILNSQPILPLIKMKSPMIDTDKGRKRGKFCNKSQNLQKKKLIPTNFSQIYKFTMRNLSIQLEICSEIWLEF